MQAIRLDTAGLTYEAWLIGTMFLFVLTCNLLGMFPFLGSPTASISMTGALAFIVFVYIHMSGIQENGLKGHFFAFVRSAMSVAKP